MHWLENFGRWFMEKHIQENMSYAKALWLFRRRERRIVYM
jgi:hypothetical protein